MYNTQTSHDLAQVQISLDNNVKWSGHFPYLFINRLKMTWDKLICGAIWICGCHKSNYIAGKIYAK